MTEYFRHSMPCDVNEVRPLARQLKEFLSQKGVQEPNLMSIDLAFTEAANNAVFYVLDEYREDPVVVEAIVENDLAEVRIKDHTPGFDFPEKVALPEEESESSRGIYIIYALMDEVRYLRGPSENCLVMRKLIGAREAETTKSSSREEDQEDAGISDRAAELQARVEELQSELAENEQIILDMSEDLSSCYESLSAIFKFSGELSKSSSLEVFSKKLLGNLNQITSSQWFLLRLKPPEAEELVVFSTSEDALNLPPIPLNALEGESMSLEQEAALSRQDVWLDSNRPLLQGDPLYSVKKNSIGLAHPFFMGDQLIGVLTLGKSAEDVPFTAAQSNVVHTFSDFLASQIVNSRFQEEQMRSRLVSRELEIATSIQKSLLPKSTPDSGDFQFAGLSHSARQVGGDFYDVVYIDDNRLLMVIADVMGKGVPAAMFAAILRSLFRAAPELMGSPAKLMDRVNRLIYEELSAVDMFVTAQLVYLDQERGQLITANAGHCPLLVSCVDGSVREFAPEGMPIGILPDTKFDDEFMDLNEVSKILLYTDGLTEARNSDGDFFQDEKLTSLFKSIQADNAKQLKVELERQLSLFQGDASLSDDQTFLLAMKRL
jgi:serine phosphatase RsbU (regulator of sigma subunit)/anti-sigma regulatory factor (Ser/Thr protein kinase)